MQKGQNCLFVLMVLISGVISAQTGIGTKNPDESSVLDISSTNKGFLLPRMNSMERDLIINPAKGLMIFNTTVNAIENNIGTKIMPIWISDGGKSAYEIWLSLGNSGTEVEFTKSLKGNDGEKGNDGSKGNDGEKGNDGNKGNDGEKGNDGNKGNDGEKGNKGDKGENAKDGGDGESAYEIWLSLGNSGSEFEFITSLKGADGKSAFDIWLSQGNSGTELEFITSLTGATGSQGLNGLDGNQSTDEVISVSNDYDLLITDYTVLCDNETKSFTINLPEVSSSTGKVYVINKIDETTNELNINPPIQLTKNSTISRLNFPKSFKIQSNGNVWYVIN
ncbi:hypothetical protein [Maribacter arcticus]|uniref:hypothetical protein n=1 Tax=Maribacter arcticus TaxID=561365 RepID=UPI0030029433